MNSIIRSALLWLHDLAITLDEKLSPSLGFKTNKQIILGYDQMLVEAIAGQVYMDTEDGYPRFVQGSEAHEVCSLVTAEDLTRWFPLRAYVCTFRGCHRPDSHTTAQHYLNLFENVIKEYHRGVSAFRAIEDAVNRDAMVADGVVLSKEEAIVARKLIANHIVGPAGRAVIAKLNAVQE